MDGDGLSRGLAQDGAIEGHLEHIAEALAVALEPLEAVAGLEVHDAVFAGEPVHAYLAGNAAVFGADGRLGDAVVQEGGGRVVQPDRFLELHDEAEVPGADDFARLRRNPLGVCLGGLAVGLACLRVHRAVRHKVLLVEGGSAFQDEAVCGASERQRRAFALGDFAAGLAAIEFGGFAESSQVVARHVPAAPAGGVVLLRGDGEESVCVHFSDLGLGWF